MSLCEMTTDTTGTTTPASQAACDRSAHLADRLQAGADALIAFARGLSDADWRRVVSPDGRTVGVIVHHVASVYPLEVQLAQQLASGHPITGVTWADVHALNAGHAIEQAAVTKEAALALLTSASADAAAAIRALTDAQLATAAPVSMYADAPLTCQFFLEDHAVRHSYHHLARLRATVEAR